MGFKRKATKATPDIYCEKEVVGREDAPKQTFDMPKKFSHILKVQDGLTKRTSRPNQQNRKEAEKGTKKFKKEFKILPNESLSAFNNRVDMFLGDPVDEKPGRVSKKKEKKKQLRQEAVKALDLAHAEEAVAKDFHKMTDKVRFGEVAMAPPTLTAKPKDRAKNRRLLLSGALTPTSKSNDFKKQEDSERPAKVKKPTRTPAEQRIIEAERVRLIQAYRKLKADRANNPA